MTEFKEEIPYVYDLISSQFKTSVIAKYIHELSFTTKKS